MRIRRGLLFWGLFLIPLGGLPLLSRAGALDPAAFVDAWRFWPLILVALGLALLFGRHRAGLVGVAAVALVLGGLAGGSLASGSLWIGSIGECAGSGTDAQALDESGAFTGDATLTIDLDCGTAHVSTTASGDWSVHADFRGAAPTVDPSGTSLAVRTAERSTRHRDDWTVAVPATQLGAIDLRVNAGSSTIDLAGANLTRLEADANAADLLIGAGTATVERLSVSVNAGRVRLTLGAGSTVGDLSANAGAIELCVSPGAGLRLRVQDQLTFAHNLDSRDLQRVGDTWMRSGLGDGNEIDLSIDGNAASFTLDPEGGCK